MQILDSEEEIDFGFWEKASSLGSSILGRHNFEHFDWVRALSIM